MTQPRPNEDTLTPVWTALFERDIPAAKAALARAKDAPPQSAARLRAYLQLFEGEHGACADILTSIAPWKLTYLDRRALLGVVEHSAVLDDHDSAAGSIELLLRCGEMSHVARLLEKAQERYGETSALAGLALAAGLALSGDAPLAVRQARAQLQKQQQSPLTFVTLGRALMALGQPEQALHALELGARLYGDAADALFLRSLALDALDRPQDALALLQAVAAQPAAHPLHVLAAARLLRRLGRGDDAAQMLDNTDLGDFLPLCALLLALTPAPGVVAPDTKALTQALALPCTVSLDTERYWPDFATQLDLGGLAQLRPALLARVRQRLVALFPTLGAATGVRGHASLAQARRIGIHIGSADIALLDPLAAHLLARLSADCEIVIIHDGAALGEARLAAIGERASEFCVPGVPVPALTKAVAELALDALLLVAPLRQPPAFTLSLARLAPLQILVDEVACTLTGATVDAHCCRNGAGWQWTYFAACSVHDDSEPATARLGLAAAWRVPLTLAQLAQDTGGRLHELRGAREWHLPAVQELGLATPSTAGPIPLHAPAAGHVLLSDVQVWNGETAFWHPATDRIAHEASFHHDRSRIASVSRVNRLTAQMLAAEVDHAFLFQPLPPVVLLARAIVVRSKASFNYFHWLFEGLAALESVLADPALADWPLLIDENLHANLEEALRRVAGPGRRILRQPQGAPVFLQQAAAGFSAHRIPYTLHPGAAFEPGDYVFCPQTLAFLRERLMGGMPVTHGHRRLFLRRRGGYRHLLNQDEVEALFVQAGFEVIDPGTMDLDTQIRTFAQASHIAGPTGAAFSNLLFAPPGARVLLFTNETTGHHFFSNLATSLGQVMTVIHGRTAQDSHPEAHQSDYALSIDMVAQALAESTSAPTP